MTKCPFCRKWVESGLRHCIGLQLMLRQWQEYDAQFYGPSLPEMLEGDEVEELERLWRLEAR